MAAPLPKLGSYELVRELGRGTTGVVYLARKHGSEEPVAIKVLLETDPEGIARFEREVELARRVQHPGIAAIRSTGMSQRRHFLVMEHVAGETLQARLARGPLEVVEAVHLVRALADAVAAAHERGVIHRDLKPANVLLAASGPKIVDFGLGRDVRELSRLTQSGTVLGTPAYMSPEQLDGRKDVDARSDVYALGVILYECLHGKHPYPARTLGELMEQVATARVVFDGKLPAGLLASVQRAMARDRGARTASAAQLRGELDRHLAPSGAVPRRRVGLALVGAFVLLGGGAAAALHRPRVESAPVPPAPSPPAAPPTERLDAVRAALRSNHLDRARDLAEKMTADAAFPVRARSEAALLGAIALLGAGKPDEARESFERADRLDAGGAAGGLARAYLAQLRMDDAEPIVESALGDPPLEEALVFLARLYADSYRPSEIVSRFHAESSSTDALAAANERASRANARADLAVELAPGDPAARRVRVEVRIVDILRALNVPAPARDVDADERCAYDDLQACARLDGSELQLATLLVRLRLDAVAGNDADAVVYLPALRACAGSNVEARFLDALFLCSQGREYAPELERAWRLGARESYAFARCYSQFVPRWRDLLGPLRRLDYGDLAARSDELHSGHQAAFEGRIARVTEKARAELARAHGDADSAVRAGAIARHLEAALAVARDDRCVRLEAARLRMGRDQLAEASNLLAGDDSPEAALLLAEISLRQGNRDRARDLARRAASSLGDAAARSIALSLEARAERATLRARSYAERACREAPGELEPHVALAAALLEGEHVELDAAHAEAERAICIGGFCDAQVLFLKVLARAFTRFEIPRADGSDEDRTRGSLQQLIPERKWKEIVDERLLNRR